MTTGMETARGRGPGKEEVTTEEMTLEVETKVENSQDLIGGIGDKDQIADKKIWI